MRVQDDKTLLVPDRLGNNRIDSLRNILQDPRVALLFLIPGCGETIRVIGRAAISIDPELAQSFVVNGKTPRAVLIVSVDRIYYQCSKAIVRSKLWDASRHVDRKSLPSAGMILAEIDRRQTRRRSPRPRRARADQGDAVLNVGRCNAARSSDRVESSPVHPHAASRSRICGGTGALTRIGARFL